MLVSDVHCIVKNPLGKSWEANSAKPIENDSTTASIVMSCLIDIFFGRGIIRLIQSKKRWIIWNTQQFCHLQKYFIICLALFENSLTYYAIINSKKFPFILQEFNRRWGVCWTNFKCGFKKFLLFSPRPIFFFIVANSKEHTGKED